MSAAEEHQPGEEARHASLRRQSDEHLQFALNRGPSAAAAAFQAGYCALLSSLSLGQLQALQDHPDASAVGLSARRLGLGRSDRPQAELGAIGYYAADQAAFRSIDECLDWASRVRAARGWGT